MPLYNSENNNTNISQSNERPKLLSRTKGRNYSAERKAETTQPNERPKLLSRNYKRRLTLKISILSQPLPRITS